MNKAEMPEYRTPESKVWYAMKHRCYNKNNKKYIHYGGRGIKVCKRWLESYENFLSDMGRKPTSKHTLDRINNEKGYSKSNCRWATYTEQNNNRRKCKPRLTIVYEGRKIDFNEAVKISGLKRRTLHARIFKQGWKVETALTQPPKSGYTKFYGEALKPFNTEPEESLEDYKFDTSTYVKLPSFKKEGGLDE